MRTNATYRSLLDKSVSSMLSAIEIYNKPNFSYREETFAILSVNSWELLLKAKLLKENNYKLRSLYILEPVTTKGGKPHKRHQKPRLNRSNNPLTCNLFDAILKLDKLGYKLSTNLKKSIETLVELRDNAIHFHNETFVVKQIQEIGFACIKNYIHIIKKWKLEIDLSDYNFYLMPLAYVDSKVFSEGIVTDEVRNYLQFVKDKIDTQDVDDKEFDIAVSIDVNFAKGNSFDGLQFKYDPKGVPVVISEEDIRQRYPLTHKDVCNKARKRYSDFLENNKFRILMLKIKSDPKLHHERRLDPDNPKSSRKPWYSANIWKILDEHYNKQ